MIVGRCQVGGIRRVWKNFDSESLELLAGHQRCMGSRVVMKEQQFRPFRTKRLMSKNHLFQLGAVETRVDGGMIWKQFTENDALAVPPNRQHHLLLVKFSFGIRLCRFSFCDSLALFCMIDIEYPFLISSGNILDPIGPSFSSEERKCKVTSNTFLVVGQFVWNNLSKFWSHSQAVEVTEGCGAT